MYDFKLFFHRAIGDIVTTLFFPIIPVIIQLGFIVFAGSVFLYLSSIGEPSYKLKNFNPINCYCSGAASKYVVSAYF